VLSPRLSVIRTICLLFYFLVSRPGLGGREFPSISFCLYVVALNVYRGSNVWGHECKSSCLVPQLQSADYRRAALNEAGQYVSAVMKRPHNHDSRTPYIPLVTALFTVYAQ